MGVTIAPPEDEAPTSRSVADEHDAIVSTGQRRPRRRVATKVRRAMVKLHRWVSFTLLGWVAVVSVTGGWLVFSDLYESWLHPSRYATSDGDVGAQAAIDAAVGAVGVPADPHVENIVTPRNGRGVYQISLGWPDPDAPAPVDEEAEPEEVYATFYIDPGSGEINDRRLAFAEGFDWWMFRGHAYLWQDNGPFGVFDAEDGWCRAGADGAEPGGARGVACDVIPNGFDLVGWFGVGFIFVLFTGIYVWYWPRVRRWATALSIRRGRGPLAFNLSLHEDVGLVVLVPLTVVAFTGMAFAFPNMTGWFQNATPADRGEELELWSPPETAVSSEPGADQSPLDADEFMLVLAEQFPDRAVDSVTPPAPDDPAATWQAWTTRGFSPWTREAVAGNSLVVADQYTGEVLFDGTPEDVSASAQLWSDWSYPLHTGDFGGTATRTVWSLVAWMPSVLGTTGLIMWFIRRRKRRARGGRRALPVNSDVRTA